MSDDGFVELSRVATGRKNEGMFVTVSSRTSCQLSRLVLDQFGKTNRIVIRANPDTGEVHILPSVSKNGNSLALSSEGLFANRLGRFCDEHGFARGRQPAEIKDGMVVFRLQRKAD